MMNNLMVMMTIMIKKLMATMAMLMMMKIVILKMAMLMMLKRLTWANKYFESWLKAKLTTVWLLNSDDDNDNFDDDCQHIPTRWEYVRNMSYSHHAEII